MKRGLRLLTWRGPLVVAGCVAVAGSLAADYSARVITWAVMTDELQTTKLATSIAETGRVLALHFDSVEAPAVGKCSLASSKRERSPARPAG
jgi:hypothetical protein